MDFPIDAFGDPYTLEQLTLPRPATGFAVQKLGLDQVLDPATGQFRPLRKASIHAVFGQFETAHAAASGWLRAQAFTPPEAGLAIVPAAFDEAMQRPVLILGVLETDPDGKTAYLTGTPLALMATPGLTGKDGA